MFTPVSVYVIVPSGMTVDPLAGSLVLVHVYPGTGCSVVTSGGVIGGTTGGFADDVPPGIAGLDLGWRANLAGQRVLAEPSAQLIVAQPATGDEADGVWLLCHEASR